MNIRELSAEDLAPLLSLYTHLHAQDDPLPPLPEVRTVWAEACLLYTSDAADE